MGYFETVRRKSRSVVCPRGVEREQERWPGSWSAPGVIEVLEPLVTDPRRERLRHVIGARLDSVTVVMDAPHDPHNAGAVLRSCDAFGVQRLHVVPRVEEFAISTTVTRGSEKWVDVELHGTADAAISTLGASGFELVSTHPMGELVPDDLRGIPRLALVLGNERDGIREDLERASSRSVRIPMTGFVESLNMSVCGAILLHAATKDRPGDLSDMDRARLYARGLFRSVPHAADVLDALRAR